MNKKDLKDELRETRDQLVWYQERHVGLIEALKISQRSVAQLQAAEDACKDMSEAILQITPLWEALVKALGLLPIDSESREIMTTVEGLLESTIVKAKTLEAQIRANERAKWAEQIANSEDCTENY